MARLKNIMDVILPWRHPVFDELAVLQRERRALLRLLIKCNQRVREIEEQRKNDPKEIEEEL